MSRELWSESEVAAWLTITSRDARKMAEHGQIPAYQLPSGEWRFDPLELQQWLETRRGTEGVSPCK